MMDTAGDHSASCARADLLLSSCAEHPMFMPQTAPKRWTAAMARRLLPDDGNRYEIIDGRLHVTPAPGWPHQTIGGRLFGELWSYLRQYGLSDTVLYSPADISWDRHTLV